MKIFKFILIGVLAFVLGLALAFVRQIRRPIANNPVSVEIERGEGPRAIAAKLIEVNLLDNERPFLLYVLLTGTRNKFYPGSYEIKSGSSLQDIITLVTNEKGQQLSVTILEGWRINDIAKEIAKKTAIIESVFKAAAPVESYEGYLFPDTYNFSPEVTAEVAVKAMRDNFDRRTKDLPLSRDDVILASIVEREAISDDERPVIAGIYLNRLKDGMALQADPTVQYAKGSWDPITIADYQAVNSPYNTYLHPGLPPGPIANPGLASLKAVKAPASHDYYFFFHTKEGQTIYSKTFQEHTQNKQKYLAD